MRSRLLAIAVLLALGSVPVAAGGEVFLSRKEAIAAAFPGAARVDRRTVVLDDAQAEAIEGRAKARLDTRLVTIYTGFHEDGMMGYAFIDIHTVRTLPEAFMVVLTPDGRVRSLRLLAFYEPQEYRPPDRWLEQFEQERLGPELRLQGKIHGISGSTLSSRAVTSAVRRTLALWEVMLKGDGEDPSLAAEPAGAPPTPGR